MSAVGHSRRFRAAPLGAIRCPSCRAPGFPSIHARDLPVGQISHLAVQPPLQKYSTSPLTQITSISLAVSPHRGAYRDRHGRGVGCDGRGSVGRVRDGGAGSHWTCERSNGALTRDVAADGEVVWS
jgi:hypothetical protein